MSHSQRLTPIDIAHKELPTTPFGGYQRNTVDQFLDDLGNDYEQIILENAKLKEQTAALHSELARYREMEQTLREALVLAQRTADETRAAAHKEAELILQNANLRAAQQIKDQQQQIEQLKSIKQKIAFELRAHMNVIQQWLDATNDTPLADAPPDVQPQN